MMMPVDTAWFDADPEAWLQREEFVRYQELARVDFRDLKSSSPKTIDQAQKRLAEQSVIIHEVRKEHAGFGVPLIAYTHDLNFGDQLEGHIKELDQLMMAEDIFDSLRRRHVALSHAILPAQVEKLAGTFSQPISILNLGSGIGLDMINVLQKHQDKVGRVDNYDTNRLAVHLGRHLTAELEGEGALPEGVVNYHCQSLMKASAQEQCHLAVLVGIICGLEDRVAETVLRRSVSYLEKGGQIVVTSSNEMMHCNSPLASFLIQHIGQLGKPEKSWGLNFRSRNQMEELLVKAGCEDVMIYDDYSFPGHEQMSDELFWGVDCLPSTVLGHKHNSRPLALPSAERRQRREGYNWIAIGRKS